MPNQELYHYGVPGMKWGKRKDKYITVRQGTKNARAAGREAWQKTTVESGGKLVGKSKSIAVYKNPADKFRGKKSARAAYIDAARESAKADKSYNKSLKEENKTSNPNRKREIVIAAGAAAGTALAAYGTYKVVNAIKNKDFKRRMDGAMRAVDIWAERGRLDIGMSQIKDVYSTHGDSIGAVIKRTISNNEVNGKVDWGAVAKRLSPL